MTTIVSEAAKAASAEQARILADAELPDDVIDFIMTAVIASGRACSLANLQVTANVIEHLDKAVDLYGEVARLTLRAMIEDGIATFASQKGAT